MISPRLLTESIHVKPKKERKKYLDFGKGLIKLFGHFSKPLRTLLGDVDVHLRALESRSGRHHQPCDCCLQGSLELQRIFKHI